MAEQIIKGRLMTDRRTYAEWVEANPIAKNGEIMVVEVPVDIDGVEQEPCLLLKIGDGKKVFEQLPWVSALSADVYDWALQPNKPVYTMAEIANLVSTLDGKQPKGNYLTQDLANSSYWRKDSIVNLVDGSKINDKNIASIDYVNEKIDTIELIPGPKGDKGDPFSIAKIYSSILEMNQDYDNPTVAEGSFVLINTNNISDPDNAKLYVKGKFVYEYVTDMSGATGIQGPQGEPGKDGLTTSIKIGSNTYSQIGGIITIPSSLFVDPSIYKNSEIIYNGKSALTSTSSGTVILGSTQYQLSGITANKTIELNINGKVIKWDGTNLLTENTQDTSIGSSENAWINLYSANVITNNIKSSSIVNINAPLIQFTNTSSKQNIVFDSIGLHPTSAAVLNLGSESNPWEIVNTYQLNFTQDSGFYDPDAEGESIGAIQYKTSRNNQEIIILNGKNNTAEDFAIKYKDSSSVANGKLGLYVNNNKCYFEIGSKLPVYKRSSDDSAVETALIEYFSWTPRITIDDVTQSVSANGLARRVGCLAIITFNITFSETLSDSAPMYIVDLPFQLVAGNYPLGDYFYQGNTNLINGYVTIGSDSSVLIRRMDEPWTHSVGNAYGSWVKNGTVWQGAFVCLCSTL